MRRRSGPRNGGVNRVALSAAFAELRRLGMIAKQAFMCCQSCAGAAITEQVRRAVDAGRFQADTFAGVVFYHRQDANQRDHGTGEFYLAYGQVTVRSETHPGGCTYGPEAEKIGATVVTVLNEFGVKTEWNGDPDTRILVKP